MLGALAVSRHDQALVALTCQHVLLGGGARYGDPVWLTVGLDGAPTFVRIGVARYGRLGIIQRPEPVHVDCAVASVDGWSGPPVGWTLEPDALPDPAPTMVGQRVRLDAGPPGRCLGVVAGGDSWDEAQTKPGQILIRAGDSRRPFSSAGDSGALVRDESDSPVGLLWGTTPAGTSIATPIGAVVDVLGIQLVRLVPVAEAAASEARR